MRNPTVPFERILAPIPPGFRKENEYDADGSGRDYAYDYLDIEEARRVVEATRLRGDAADAMRQKAQPPPKAADWDKVFALGVAVLTAESKDLRVAAWVVEALGQLRGFPGLGDGFALFRRLQGRYRDSSYPRGDAEDRVRQSPYEYLDGERILPLLIRRLPLIFAETGEPISYLACKEAERNEAREADEDRSPESAEGGLALRDLLAAVETTAPADLHRLAVEVGDCLIAFKAWDRSTDRLWHGQKFPPSLSRIGEALADCAHEVRKMFPDPDHPAAAALDLALRRYAGGRPPAPARPPADDFVAAPPRDDPPAAPPAPRAGRTPDPEPIAPEPEPRPDPPGAAGPVGPPEDAESAYRRVVEAAAFLRGVDPGDPVPYLLIRSLRLGELFGAGAGADPGDDPPHGPPSATRKDLRRRAAAGDWEDVVALTEEVLARPEGRGWLDAHRLAIRGLEECGRDRAALACRALLAAALDHAPDLAAGELDDGTPAASPETRAWLAQSLQRAPEPERTRAPDPDDGDGPPPAAAPAPAADAEAALREGRTEEAVATFAAALDAAAGDRARYLATLRFAEVCVEEGLDQLALPLLEGLAGTIDDAILRGWEGRPFFVRGATCLHEALARDGDGASADRLARAWARLASLAPAVGLRRRGR